MFLPFCFVLVVDLLLCSNYGLDGCSRLGIMRTAKEVRGEREREREKERALDRCLLVVEENQSEATPFHAKKKDYFFLFSKEKIIRERLEGFGL